MPASAIHLHIRSRNRKGSRLPSVARSSYNAVPTLELAYRMSPSVINRSMVCLATATLLATASCEESTAPDPVSVSAVIRNSVVASGSSTSLVISATNLGARPATINVSCNGTYRTLTAAGEVVSDREFCGLILVARFKELAPGEQVVYEVRWDAVGTQGAMAPGEYRIIGEVSGRLSSPVRVVVQ